VTPVAHDAPPPVDIRPEAAGQERAVAGLLSSSFGRPEVAELVASLRDSEWWVDGLSLTALRDGEVVGYLLFTHALVDAPDALVEVLVLSPLAVAPAHQGLGIGSALVREGLARLSNRREPLVFLEGSPRYYPRFGFQPATPLGFVRPSPRIPEPAFMVRLLRSYEPSLSGGLVYPDAFWRHDCVGLRA
jgi:putative acetyltransferase